MRFMMKALELNQILELISKHAKSDTIRNEIIHLEPMTDLQSIHLALDETMDMTALILRAGVLPFLEDFDIHELLKYASLDRVFSIQELLYVRLFLLMERDIIKYYKELDRLKISARSLTPYFQNMHTHRSLLDYIQSKIDEDGQILDDATPELLKIRKEKSRLDKQLQDKLQKFLIDHSAYLNELVIVQRNDRFCIPVKDTYKNKIKGVVHDFSASKQTVYIEPEATRQITALIEHLKVDEEKEIQKIIASLSEEVHNAHASLKDNLDLFLGLDFISSKAQYALKLNAMKPQINDVGTISLIKAKHPLLDQKTAVPITLELNKDIKTLLITGPNTGGKTVALKTVGLLTLMTQCGILIPASEASNVAVFDQVFADIGDEQSILQSLSTFSSHLNKIISMIEGVKDNTLVLLDELGSGTDPNEGVSLAIAILNAFKPFDIRMMVTTHYSELKSYAYEQPNMTTASVAFDKKTLKPLYYLQMGTTGSSHAFLIARRLGLKEEVVQDAETIYQGRQTDLAKVMEKLNDEMLYIEKQKENLADEIEESRNAKLEFQRSKELLLAEQDKTIEKVRAKEEKAYNELKDEVREMIVMLQKKNEISKPEIAAIKYKLNQQKDNEKLVAFEDELQVDDLVFILPYQQYGKIKSIKNDDCRVVFGKFDLVFKSYDLRKEEPKKEPNKAVKTEKISIGDTPARSAKFELDLRGYRFDEVKEAMDQALDSAILSGLETMRIIHGFGSGAVRKAVYDYIKSSPYIKTHRFGGEGEGLNGVTIITLK
ncbi:MAG: endonuclease MutS2 [Acholeplasmataceae bacterium]|nr:endonuclease MutS2 [Acholeplasmataceae bacterium]